MRVTNRRWSRVLLLAAMYTVGMLGIFASGGSSDSGTSFTFGRAELIETSPGDAAEPKVAVDSVGNALVVWRQNDGTDDSIWENPHIM